MKIGTTTSAEPAGITTAENLLAAYQREFDAAAARAAGSQNPRVTELFELIRRRRPGVLARLRNQSSEIDS